MIPLVYDLVVKLDNPIQGIVSIPKLEMFNAKFDEKAQIL
jgi:hypothetical protein